VQDFFSPYEKKLAKALEREKKAFTRLQRAQTLYVKYYRKRTYIEEKMLSDRAEVLRVITRLEGAK
jgi:hypothetical protein